MNKNLKKWPNKLDKNDLLFQYVTQTLEVESPSTLHQLSEARKQNEHLSEKLSNQRERCQQLEENIRHSDEVSCNLQHKVFQLYPFVFMITV